MHYLSPTCAAVSVALSCFPIAAQRIAQQEDTPSQTPVQATAQHVPEEPGAGASTSQKPLAIADLFVPIHTQPADPAGGEYGWWAASGGYKVSFHTGFVFYPFVGPKTENLPFAWKRTRLGGQLLAEAGTAPAHRHTATRYEYVYPSGVVETYDVKVEGVEQSFTIPTKPQQAGDLVISGDIESSLRAPASAGHGKVEFKDAEGNARVVYGAAWAIDAAGQKIAIETGWDGSSITLRVPAAFVAQAAYPLTIDPLTTPVIIATWGGTTFGLPSYPAIGRDDESTTSNIMTFYARQFSATDFDGYGRLTNNDFTNSNLVYTDVTASWSTGRAGVASVGGANRWALCLERIFSNGTAVRIYAHDFLNTTQNSGITLFHLFNANTQRHLPEIGGTRSFSSGNNALFVYQYDNSLSSNTNNSEVYGCLVNVSGTGSFGTEFLLDTTGGVGTTYDRESPCVNQESNGGTASWIVGWQQLDRSIVSDDWDFIIARITSAGAPAGRSFLGPSGGLPHKTNVRIAGREGRYMGSYLISDVVSTTGKGFEVHRFNWIDTAASPTKLNINQIASGGTANYVNGAIAYDTLSDSHWALVYQRGGYTTSDLYVVRVGYTGGNVEVRTVYAQASTGGYSPNITFDDDSRSFLICYGSTETPPSGLPVYGVTFNYNNAQNVLYGTGCGPGLIGANRNPYAGDEFYAVSLTSLPASVPAALFVSGSAAATSLTPIGATGCFLNIGTSVWFTVGGTATSGGVFTVPLPLPDDPVAIGNVYLQGAYGYPAAAWPLKVATTRGLRAEIR